MTWFGFDLKLPSLVLRLYQITYLMIWYDMI